MNIVQCDSETRYNELLNISESEEALAGQFLDVTKSSLDRKIEEKIIVDEPSKIPPSFVNSIIFLVMRRANERAKRV